MTFVDSIGFWLAKAVAGLVLVLATVAVYALIVVMAIVCSEAARLWGKWRKP